MAFDGERDSLTDCGAEIETIQNAINEIPCCVTAIGLHSRFDGWLQLLLELPQSCSCHGFPIIFSANVFSDVFFFFIISVKRNVCIFMSNDMRERDKGKEGDKSSKSINNAKTNDRKFLTSGTRAIYFSASIEDRNMCFLPIMCHARCFFSSLSNASK